MSDIVQRISEFAKNQNITIAEIERKISASKGVLSRAINNKTDISAKWIGLLVENYPILSEKYILTGKGEMLKSAPGSQPTAHTPQPDERLCEPSSDYPASVNREIKLLRQHIIALERTIRDKEEIIRLLKQKL